MMRKLIVALGATALLLSIAPVASATEVECDENPEVLYSPYQNDGFPRGGEGFTSTVTIITEDDLPVCEPVEVTMAAYATEGPTYATAGTQTLYDKDTLSTTEAGEHTLTVEEPPCFWQIDTVHGTFVPEQFETGPGDIDVIAYENGGSDGGQCDDDEPNPPPTEPPPTPEPPQPTMKPRAHITPPTCNNQRFVITLDNERSDLRELFVIKVNGKTVNEIMVPAGESRTIQRHAENGDRVQVFDTFQLAEANAHIGPVCEEEKPDKPKKSTDKGHERGRRVETRVLANTGANTGFWIVMFVLTLAAGVLFLLASRKRA